MFEGGKAQVRLELEGRRRALTAEEVKMKGGEAQQCLAALSSFQNARLVALYAAEPFEVGTGLLWAGHRVCLPRVNKGSKVLSFHEVASPDALVAVRRLLEPPPGAPHIALDDIDFWVVPGVGFTNAGERIGRGAGYYDSTLVHARPSAPKIGLTFECCVVDALPTEPHDLRMDGVVTEKGYRRSAKTHE